MFVVRPVAAHRRVTGNTTGCGFDSHSKKLNIYYFPQHAIPTEYSGKWRAECLDTSLPTLQHAGNSVKLKKIYI